MILCILGIGLALLYYNDKVEQNNKEIIREKVNIKRIETNLNREWDNHIYSIGYIQGMKDFQKNPNINIDSLENIFKNK